MRSQDQSSDKSARRPAAAARHAAPASRIPPQHALASRSPQAVLALQRAAGNAAVAGLAEERETHVHGAGCGHGTPVQRTGVDQVLRSAGTPLAAPVRQDMEARLGADFSDVRLHTDAAARRSAADVGARAYTSGSHVVIGDGGGDPHTLAHELTHVIQQRQGPVAGTDNGSGLRVSDPSDRFERAAEENARRVMSEPAPAVQRAVADTPAPAAGDAAGHVVQRMNNGGTTTGPAELALMPGADARDMGSGYTKYTVQNPNPAGDPLPLFRAMSSTEFQGLRAGALPQGEAYQGFSPRRKYSEDYITGGAQSPTHLVEFYRTSLVDALGNAVPDLDTFLKTSGAGEKAEAGVMSTAVGMTASYSQEVHANTRHNDKLEQQIAKLRTELQKDEADAANPGNKHRDKAAKRVADKNKKIDALSNGSKHPAKGDAVRAFNQAMRNGQYTWRLVAFRTS
ncbi:DUF4157 domain-containing protein [Streptomyces sp. NPDC059894]|uniref:eCIS core domain-containing protein n=1 Tax=unclassified Streptomyces TaxID=2593676 RepID=UPI00366414D2